MTALLRIAGLDISLTATGIACACGQTTTVGTKPRPDRFARYHQLAEQIIAALSCWWPDIVVIEKTVITSARNAQAVDGIEAATIIRDRLTAHGARWVDLTPATVKKLATGKGNADKAAMLGAAIRRLSYDGNDHNAADALWLRAAGLIHYGHPDAPTLPLAHLDALAKVQWPELDGGAA